MIFLANRANLDRRSLLTRIHSLLQTQVDDETGPIERVWYRTSRGNKVGVSARLDAPAFAGEWYPVETVELQISFDVPPDRSVEYYAIQWVDSERELMLGWHQDETHPSLGRCHFQIDHRDETIQRLEAAVVDAHPLNVFDHRMEELVAVLDALHWRDGRPQVPAPIVE